MSSPQLGIISPGFQTKQVLSINVNLARVPEINIASLARVLGRFMCQLTRQNGVDWKESITELGVAEETIAVFVEDLHEVEDVATGD